MTNDATYTARYPVAISTALPEDGPLVVVALCNDGTLWDFDERDKQWKQLPPIPQPTPQETVAVNADGPMDLRARVERLEQAQPEGCDDLLTRVRRLELPVQSLLGQNGELRARVMRLERLEKAQQQGQPEGPNLAEPLARTMEQRLPRVLHFHGVPLVPPIDCPDPMLWIAERVYEMAQQQQPAPSTPAGQGELVGSVVKAIVGVPVTSFKADDWTPEARAAILAEARAAILAVADWLSGMGREFSADLLRDGVRR